MRPNRRGLLLMCCLGFSWSAGGDAARAQPGNLNLKIMSFNIRHGRAQDGPNRWSKRGPLVPRVIRHYGPDIACLQEVLDFQLEEILQALPDYEAIGVGRDDGRSKGEYAAILYREAYFDLMESGTFWFSETPDESGSVAWGASIPRVCAWAHLTHKRTGKPFYVYNVHLDHQSELSRGKSVERLVERINARAERDPVFVAGDFNADENSRIIRYLTGEAPDAVPDGSDAPKPPAWVDTYRRLHPDAPDAATYHGFKGVRNGPKIDYVFAPAWGEVRDAGILTWTQEGKYPSDHYPVVARVVVDERKMPLEEKIVPEGISLLGRPLRPLPPGDRTILEARVTDAYTALYKNPEDEEAWILVGRRLGEAWRMKEAIDVLTRALRKFPRSAPLHRHRGHRSLSLRRFDDARKDLERAAELLENQPLVAKPGEPSDGSPAALKFEIYYHWGLAHYYKGDFESAVQAFERAREHGERRDDDLVAAVHWSYMALRRLGRESEAERLLEPIRSDMTILENHAYHRLTLMYKGLLKPEELLANENVNELDQATLGYGLGNWYYYHGDRDRARERFESVVQGPIWPAFGFIAAEADLARLIEPAPEPSEPKPQAPSRPKDGA